MLLPRRWQVVAPLAQASADISEALARRMLERRGMLIQERRLAGTAVITYSLAGPANVPPIVLIHGLGASAMTWSRLVFRLQGRAPIYALDLPGFGLSALPPDVEPFSFRQHADVVVELLQQVVGRPAVLLGNSLGGWLALRIGLDRPELAARLIALNPAGVALEPTLWQSTASFFQPGNCAAVRRFYRALFGRVPTLVYLGQPETLRRLWRRSVQGVLAAADEADFLAPEALRRLKPPATIVWGTVDRLLPAQSLDVLRASLPAANWVLLPGCGHMPQIERPGEVAAAVCRELEQLATQRAPRPQRSSLVV